jgi:hypothetical protein
MLFGDNTGPVCSRIKDKITGDYSIIVAGGYTSKNEAVGKLSTLKS